MSDLFNRNATETLIFADGTSVCLFPAGFAQHFKDPDPEGTFDEDGAEGSLYGYLRVGKDDTEADFDLNYAPILPLREGLESGKIREVTEREGRDIDPGLFAHLDAIQRGER